MICTAVPTEAVDIVWKDVSGMLAKAINLSLIHISEPTRPY